MARNDVSGIRHTLTRHSNISIDRRRSKSFGSFGIPLSLHKSLLKDLHDGHFDVENMRSLLGRIF